MPTDPPLTGSGHGTGAPRRAIADRQQRMGSAMVWTVVGTIVPGLGLWRAGRRVAGGLVLGLTAVLIGVLVYVVLNRKDVIAYAANPRVLTGIAIVLAVLAVLWVVVIGATHLALRPAPATSGQRVAGAALVGVLSLAVAAPLALASHTAYTAASFVQAVFPSGGEGESETVPTISNTVDPWAEKDRLNVLILGGDSGAGRSASVGMRTDTVIVASIDTRTGQTTLFSLPRQTARMPFPRDSELSRYFPNGWYDGNDPLNSDYWLNAMYRFARTHVPSDVLGRTRHLPEDIMKVSVGEALGLDIDYFVTVNLDGAKDIISALGGVDLNVNSPIPIGGNSDRNILPNGWIEPGKNQHFGGRLGLWYARGRWGYDDYSRMSRQRCLINAVAQQANPANVLAHFEKIAAAGKRTVSTDLPDTMVGPVIELADRVKGTRFRSIVFINGKDGFSTTAPNWNLVRKQVQKALKESAGAGSTATSSAKPRKTSSASEGLESECGYHPSGFIPKGYPGTKDHPNR